MSHIDENEESDYSGYIDFIKIYDPVLRYLANENGNIIIPLLLDKIHENIQTNHDIKTIQTWLSSPEIDNILANMSQNEINAIISNAKRPPEIKLYEDAIGIADKHGHSVVAFGKKRKCLITHENTKPTEPCINLHNQTYSANAFRTYYQLEKEKQKTNPDYEIITPTRAPISKEEQRILDQFFTSLDKPGHHTRSRKRTHTNGGKSRKYKNVKKRRYTYKKKNFKK